MGSWMYLLPDGTLFRSHCVCILSMCMKYLCIIWSWHWLKKSHGDSCLKMLLCLVCNSVLEKNSRPLWLPSLVWSNRKRTQCENADPELKVFVVSRDHRCYIIMSLHIAFGTFLVMLALSLLIIKIVIIISAKWRQCYAHMAEIFQIHMHCLLFEVLWCLFVINII